jgi:hypothetical protein
MSEYDIWVNMLHFPTNAQYSELGQMVWEKLRETKPKGEGSYRQIIVGGS